MSSGLPKLNIVICDDEKSQQDMLAPIVSEIVRKIGFEPVIALYDEIEKLEPHLNTRPHIVIVDNVFGSENNKGVAFIAKEKVRFPDIVFVLLTGNTFNVEQLGFRLPNPDVIATKAHMPNQKYQSYLAQEIFSHLSRYPIAAVSTEESEPYKIGNFEIDTTELQSLVEQSIFEAGLVIEQEVPQARLKRLSGGYSGAIVLELSLTGKTRWSGIPTVVKIAPRDWIDSEINAFQTFVRWQLPHTLRVDIVGKGTTRYFGAVCYAFVLAGEMKSQSTTQALSRQNSRVVKRVLKDLLEAKSTGWYNPIKSESIDLTPYLANRREFDGSKDGIREERFSRSLDIVSKNDGLNFFQLDGGYKIEDITIRSPRRAIFQHEWGQVVECFCHGDLNSNNVMTNSAITRLGLIDFSDSGRNHVFRDFVSFEASVRLEWGLDEDEPAVLFTELLTAEKGLYDLNSARFGFAPSYIDQVRLIRAAAFKRFSHVPINHYAVLVALHHWKVNAVGDWSIGATRRAMAAMVGSLEVLGASSI